MAIRAVAAIAFCLQMAVLLFVIFLAMATGITIAAFVKKLSLIPILGMACCLYLMIEIPTKSWGVFFGWMAFGLVIYFSYGFWKSKLAARLARKRRHGRKGPLDFRNTVRHSLSYGGVPAEPKFKYPRPSKPEIMVIADISFRPVLR